MTERLIVAHWRNLFIPSFAKWYMVNSNRSRYEVNLE
jgi:hypothetical protein